MTLKYNGTSPTAIKYNGTDLTVLKYGTTAVWGKPYSLSISAGANTTVTVNRTSSPNQGASTGTLSSGSVIYYGDVITVSYSVSSGYKISTATVNGSTFTSGQSFTVTSAISVVTTAEVSASWHTVFTGSRKFTFAPSNYGNTTVTFEGIKANVETKITAEVHKDDDYYGAWDSSYRVTYSLNSVSLPHEIKNAYVDNPSDVLIRISKPTTANTFPIYRQIGYDYGWSVGCSQIVITKVEQYY